MLFSYGKMGISNLKRQFKDSGQLTISNSQEILTTQVYVFTLDERFKPYDEATLVNLNSDNDVIILINNRHKSTLPAGNQTTLSGHNITDLRVINNGSTTINAEEIVLQYRHTNSEGKKKLGTISTAFGIAGNLKLLGVKW